jgi:hypothetical protein
MKATAGGSRQAQIALDSIRNPVPGSDGSGRASRPREHSRHDCRLEAIGKAALGSALVDTPPGDGGASGQHRGVPENRLERVCPSQVPLGRSGAAVQSDLDVLETPREASPLPWTADLSTSLLLSTASFGDGVSRASRGGIRQLPGPEA